MHRHPGFTDNSYSYNAVKVLFTFCFPAIELEYPEYIKFIDDLVSLSNTFFQGAGGNENFLRTK